MSTERPVREAHPELFHYTNLDGLEGILRSQYLWATHWQHLNDAKELEHFANTLPQLVKPGRVELANILARQDDNFKHWMAANGGVDLLCEEQSQGLAKVLLESVVNPDPMKQLLEFYVTSLCSPEGAYEGVRAHGLLSQWRYYGQQGGYAIVLDTAKLEELMYLEHDRWKCQISLGDVGYSHETPDVLESRIDALQTFRKAISACKFESEKEWEPLFDPVLQCFIHYKHWCFAEECEVRLVTVLNGPKMREVHKEEGTEWPERERHYYNGVPRIHLFDGLEVLERPHRLPITRILVGPEPGQRKREAELLALLDELQYDIPVTLSEMPIRF